MQTRLDQRAAGGHGAGDVLIVKLSLGAQRNQRNFRFGPIPLLDRPLDRTQLLSIWFDRNVLLSDRQWPQDFYLAVDAVSDRMLRVPRGEDWPLSVTVKPAKEEASVSQPLDDGSFLYFLRTIPLEVGQTYDFNRYFRPDRNPVRIKVLRKERVKVPAGTFDAIVVQPVIKTKGIFSENGHAEVWLSDDDRHIMLQLKSALSFGSLNLYLKSYSPSPNQ